MHLITGGYFVLVHMFIILALVRMTSRVENSALL